MTMEVSCGRCDGRLLIEVPGGIATCPHCGAHMSVPEFDADPSYAPSATDSGEIPFLSDPPTIVVSSDFLKVLRATVIDPPPLVNQEIDCTWMEAVTPSSSNIRSTRTSELLLASANQTDENSVAQKSTSGVDQASRAGSETSEQFLHDPFPHSESTENQSIESPQSAFEEQKISTSPDQPASESSTLGGSFNFSEASATEHLAKRDNDESRSRQSFLTMLLVIVGSYASLLTIYVAYQVLFGRSHQLESLPDLKTVQQRGGRAVVPSPENKLPPGHELKLGQSRRYGNIRVTPLRVTRGPITFAHYSGDRERERAPSDPVLKLWLKFENLSDRQTITPLDPTLMYFHRSLGNGEVAAYNIIFPNHSLMQEPQKYFFNFDRIAVDSEWTIVGQNTSRALAPHESCETFVPSEENLDQLPGSVVWRVHFRKGHGPKTGNGVTTLIDVHFRTDEIVSDPV
jgi:hypothetical protein